MHVKNAYGGINNVKAVGKPRLGQLVITRPVFYIFHDLLYVKINNNVKK